MEPVREALTSRAGPGRATMAIMSSAALPKVALRSPPMVGPVCPRGVRSPPPCGGRAAGRRGRRGGRPQRGAWTLPQHDVTGEHDQQHEPPGELPRRATVWGGGVETPGPCRGAARLLPGGVRCVLVRHCGVSDAVPVPLPRTLRTGSGPIPAWLRILAMGGRGLQRSRSRWSGPVTAPASRASFEAASTTLRVGGDVQPLRAACPASPPRLRVARAPPWGRVRAGTASAPTVRPAGAAPADVLGAVAS